MIVPACLYQVRGGAPRSPIGTVECPSHTARAAFCHDLWNLIDDPQQNVRQCPALWPARTRHPPVQNRPVSVDTKPAPKPLFKKVLQEFCTVGILNSDFEQVEGRVMHTFAYVRVSTSDQTVENQALEIEKAGYVPDAIYSDTISGKVPAMARPGFASMMDSITRTRTAKRLIVSKLDRLGRDTTDIIGTVRSLEGVGCTVRVLQLGDLDLTCPAGKLIMTTLAAVSEMERDLIIERTIAGLARARAEGKRLGRPKSTTDKTAAAIRAELGAGASISKVARTFGVSRATIMRVQRSGSGQVETAGHHQG